MKLLPIVIKYKEEYWVKFAFRYIKETQDEGGGWYSHTGKSELVCFVSRIKHFNQIPDNQGDITMLSEEAKRLFEEEKILWENSAKHKELLKSNCKIKP